MPGVHTFYDGSKLLDPVAELTGFETDKLNLVFCQFLSIPLAIAYSWLFPATKVSTQWRLIYPLIVGFSLCYFCYGSAIKHICCCVSICYLLMKYAPAKHVHKAVFIFSMGYLSFIHWFRWYILSHYYIDVTGPIMLVVQKCTTLAFSLHDGKVKKAGELNEIQKREAIREVPSVLEYASYIFAFQTVLTGPLSFYSDYIDFVRGVTPIEQSKEKRFHATTPWLPSFTKLATSLCCLGIILFFSKGTNPEVIAEEANLQLPWWKWWALFWVVIFMQRVRYYYAWILADAICNFSGFGFNGFTADGKERWDLVSNVDIWEVESATSFKRTLDGWNKTSMYWLRRVAYDRVPKNCRTISTYLLSAMWHGFSAGYYITFLSGALVTLGARNARHCLRHHFQGWWLPRLSYDAMTFLATKIALIYVTYPFVTMHWNPGWMIYTRLYFFVHILALFSILALPKILRPLSSRQTAKKVIPDGTTHSASSEHPENGKTHYFAATRKEI